MEQESTITRADPAMVSLMLGQAVTSSAVSALAAFAAFLLFSLYDSNIYLLLWTLCAVIISASRALLFSKPSKQTVLEQPAKWLKLHYLTGLGSAASWGLLVLMPSDHLPIHMQALPWGVPLLVAATAMSTYSILLRHYRDYLIVLTTLVLAGLWAQHGSDSVGGLVVYLLFGPVIYITGSRYHRNLVQTHEARAHAEQMLDELQALNQEMTEQRSTLQHEEQIACHVFDALTRHNERDIPGVHAWNQAMGNLSGDLIQLVDGPAGQTYVLLGDFTGHGLPAALGAVPASTIFTTMASKGLSVPDIAAELNRKLFELLPTGYFCCAVVMELAAERTHLHAWNGGLPPMMVRKGNTGEVVQLPAENLPLGIVGDKDFTRACIELNLQAGDEVYVYSDGLTEAENTAGEMWGRERLLEFLSHQDLPSPRIDSLKEQVLEFTKQAPPSDDISLVVIEATAKLNSQNAA